MLFKKLFLLILFAFLFSFISCKKENANTNPNNNIVDSNKVVLRIQSSTDTSVTFNWSTILNTNFRSYNLVRKDSATDIGTIVAVFSNRTDTTYTDTSVPYLPSVEYQIIVDIFASPDFPTSNTVAFTRPIQVMDIAPFDVQFDSTGRLLYLFETPGRISIYSLVSNSIVKSVNTGATIGYCGFGVYNGVKELYVPRYDGRVFIYNAQTLIQIDELNTGQSSTSCVVYNGGVLYVSTSTYPYPLKSYSRSTKALLSQSGDNKLTRFKKIPNSNTRLIEISINLSPVDVDYYDFDSTGFLLSHLNDIYHGDFTVYSDIFEIFPSGDKYITSMQGVIYNSGMVYETTLPHGSLVFTGFAIDDQNIYGSTRTKTIEIYPRSNYLHAGTIHTKAYPFRFFKDGSGFICVSSPAPMRYIPWDGEFPDKILVERIP